MRTRLLWILTLALALGWCVNAATPNVAGTWKAEFTTPDGTPRVNTFVFKVDGDKVTGTVAGAQDETAIKDGVLNGDSISFTAERPFGTFVYKGKISGDTIKFSVQYNENTFEMTAKRTQ